MPHQSVPRANRRFARSMRQALTPAEMRLWMRLRNRTLGRLRFRRQVPMGPYILDFFCAEAKLVIEVDGDQHGFDAALRADAARDAWLTGQGHLVLRFTNDEVLKSADDVCVAILAAAEARRAEYSLPDRSEV